MKKLLAIVGLALLTPLAACETTPRDYAQQTVLDEKLGIAVTEAYTAASTLGFVLAQNGQIDVARFKALDQQGFDAVQAVRAAYLAGNAEGYLEAVVKARAAIAGIGRLAKREGDLR